MSENNKVVVRRLLDEVWNKGNLSLVDELFTPNFEFHDSSTPDLGRGPESEKKRVTLYRNAFPDLRIPIADLLPAGETPATRSPRPATHTPPLTATTPTPPHLP